MNSSDGRRLQFTKSYCGILIWELNDERIAIISLRFNGVGERESFRINPFHTEYPREWVRLQTGLHHSRFPFAAAHTRTIKIDQLITFAGLYDCKAIVSTELEQSLLECAVEKHPVSLQWIVCGSKIVAQVVWI